MSSTRMGVSDTRMGVSNTCMGVSNTRMGVSNTPLEQGHAARDVRQRFIRHPEASWNHLILEPFDLGAI